VAGREIVAGKGVLAGKAVEGRGRRAPDDLTDIRVLEYDREHVVKGGDPGWGRRDGSRSGREWSTDRLWHGNANRHNKDQGEAPGSGMSPERPHCTVAWPGTNHWPVEGR